jgi:hypothetical protein
MAIRSRAGHALRVDDAYELDHSRFPYVGSLLMSACPYDEYGHTYQVLLKLRPGGWGTEDLIRDDHGRILVRVVSEQGHPMTGTNGWLVQVAPKDVSNAAEEWLAGKAT